MPGGQAFIPMSQNELSMTTASQTGRKKCAQFQKQQKKWEDKSGECRCFTQYKSNSAVETTFPGPNECEQTTDFQTNRAFTAKSVSVV